VEEPIEHVTETAEHPERRRHALGRAPAASETAFGCPRDFLNNRFVYLVVSPRARGLSVGINMNPDKKCNFNCVYCEVHRDQVPRELHLDVDVMGVELKQTLEFVLAGRLGERPWYRAVPTDLLRLRHVTLSGDGEPTFALNFVEAVQTVVHVRAMGGFPFFKLVLITNATGLDQPQVREGLRYFTRSDEIWAKLDGGTQKYLSQRRRRPDSIGADLFRDASHAEFELRPSAAESTLAHRPHGAQCRRLESGSVLALFKAPLQPGLRIPSRRLALLI
jgi:hypothetical protein